MGDTSDQSSRGPVFSNYNVFQASKDNEKANGNNNGLKLRSPRPAPLIVGNECSRCKFVDVNIASEALTCFKCESMFHAKCGDVNKTNASDAACTSSFYTQFGPRNSRTGANSQRYGNFYFCCDECDVHNNSKSCVKVNMVETQTIQSLTASSSHTQEASVLDTFKSDVMGLLQDFKTDIISYVSTVVDKELGTPCKDASSDSVSPMRSYANVLATEPPAVYSHSVEPAAQGSNALKKSSGSHSEATYHASRKETLILDNPTCQDDLSEVPKVITELLFDTPLLALNTKQLESEKKIVLVFPSSAARDKAKALIESNDTMHKFGFQVTFHNKALPKVTINNIPLDVFDSLDSNMDINTFRSKGKQALHDVIPLKNSGLKAYIDQGHAFEVVYISLGKMSATAGVKVSPQIRDFLTSPTSNQIFILNSACPVKDRFVIRQCFNCQKLGHISKVCPELSKTTVCMYCSGKHATKQCNVKDDPLKYRCRNCSLSKDPRVSSSCHTHHAGSNSCPIIQQAINRYRENTQRSSKN